MARYEELRDSSLSRQRRTQNLGLAVFCHRGMVAWMKTWADHIPAERVPERKTSACTAPIPAGVQGEMVRVLVSMVFAAKREV